MNNLYGQYRSKNSIIHRIDPRLKMFYVVSLGIFTFSIRSTYSAVLFFCFLVVLIAIARIRPSELIAGTKRFFYTFSFILIMYFLFSRNNMIAGYYTVYRFLCLIWISFVLTYTTSIKEMISSIELLAKPLKIFNVKPRNIAVMIAAAVRFLPMMFIYSKRIKDSMDARLSNFKKPKQITHFMICVLEKMIKSASNMSDAINARIYDENLKAEKIGNFKFRDYASILAVLIVFLLI